MDSQKLNQVIRTAKHLQTLVTTIELSADSDYRTKSMLESLAGSIGKKITKALAIIEFLRLATWITEKYGFITLYNGSYDLDIYIDKKDENGERDKMYDPMPVLTEILTWLGKYGKDNTSSSPSSSSTSIQMNVHIEYKGVDFTVNINTYNFDKCELVPVQHNYTSMEMSDFCKETFKCLIDRSLNANKIS